MQTNKQVGLYTQCHDAHGEPSWKECSEEEAKALMAGDVWALQAGGFDYSKWDLRTRWIKTTPAMAKKLFKQAKSN